MSRPRHRFYVDLPGEDSWWQYVWTETDAAEKVALKAGNQVGAIVRPGANTDETVLLTPLYCRLMQTTAAQRRLFRHFNRKLRGSRK